MRYLQYQGVIERIELASWLAHANRDRSRVVTCYIVGDHEAEGPGAGNLAVDGRAIKWDRRNGPTGDPKELEAIGPRRVVAHDRT